MPIGINTYLWMCYNRGMAYSQSATKWKYIRSIRDRSECLICTSTDKLEWHHVNHHNKITHVTRMTGYGYKAIDAEMAKCWVLCNSCHLKLHLNLICVLPQYYDGYWGICTHFLFLPPELLPFLLRLTSWRLLICEGNLMTDISGVFAGRLAMIAWRFSCEVKRFLSLVYSYIIRYFRYLAYRYKCLSFTGAFVPLYTCL